MSINSSVSRPNLVSAITSKIRNKLILSFLLVSLVPLFAFAWAMQQQSGNTLRQQAFSQLNAVQTIKANQISQYFTQIKNQVTTFSENEMVVDAMTAFPVALSSAIRDNGVPEEDLEQAEKDLFTYYAQDFATEYQSQNSGANPPIDGQFSLLDDDSIYLQNLYIKQNPKPARTERQNSIVPGTPLDTANCTASTIPSFVVIYPSSATTTSFFVT